jgi:hypothetical protein
MGLMEGSCRPCRAAFDMGVLVFPGCRPAWGPAHTLGWCPATPLGWRGTTAHGAPSILGVAGNHGPRCAINPRGGGQPRPAVRHQSSGWRGTTAHGAPSPPMGWRELLRGGRAEGAPGCQPRATPWGNKEKMTNPALTGRRQRRYSMGQSRGARTTVSGALGMVMAGAAWR